jgi:hypothetical protein
MKEEAKFILVLPVHLYSELVESTIKIQNAAAAQKKIGERTC